MSWCKDAGIPHSEFLRWDVDDRAKILAFMLEEGTKCALCGTAEWEWDEEQGGDRRAYEPVERFCMGCHLKDIASDGQMTPGSSITLIATRTRAYAQDLVRRMKADLYERD